MQPNLRVSAGGEEVFKPLTQKNLTTGAEQDDGLIRIKPELKSRISPKAKKRRKINGKTSRGRFTS